MTRRRWDSHTDRTLETALRGWMLGGMLELEILSTDRYGRRVGILRDGRSRNLNLMMVEEGLAYAYTRYGTLDGVDESERRARSDRRGVWRRGELERPWDYRRRVAARQSRVRRMRWVARVVFIVMMTTVLFVIVRWAWPWIDGEMAGIVAAGLDGAVNW